MSLTALSQLDLRGLLIREGGKEEEGRGRGKGWEKVGEGNGGEGEFASS